MKRYNWLITAILISAFIIFGNISSLAQKIAVTDDPTMAVDELRPFDFSDKFYASNGVMPNTILNRSNGADGLSVLDFTSDSGHNNVRLLATYPAYGRDGKILYWNFYGELYKDGITDDPAGRAANEIANNFPVYVFPGEGRNVGDRQSPVIDNAEGYFEKNVLGLSVVMVVRYNEAVLTKADELYLEDLAKQNGIAADGMPVIRTVKQLGQLQRRGLVSITPRDSDPGKTSFIVGKVIQYPQYGAITPDAFLLYTKNGKGNPLASEIFFIKTFDCVKNNGSSCY